ncbi:MAG: hypothetical protein COU46_02240 [Candidatus Niyogibacteria bacterium CG10_big_fil_rev_8_21_14_0_10_42_19]|uniref:Zinc finger DksA/TraR C4-type domain-containing protein n=1 Tax=Candidatus Niyogibacteria bacterium CG10_big_fil_rev_8_21_14_0_10_42_19 TaxID=1974725 RepID=A0A2H0TFF8_9BACT|nr:MAG: hypothetical protein COU46_02240 [Candidatus Niyogibacteria bacterium CG10_big_fil_rev_8_21_14_0_10_42_19]
MEIFDHLRVRLNNERQRLEEELMGISKRDPHQKGEWTVKAPEFNSALSDASETSDVFEEMDIRTSVEHQLKGRLDEVNAALKRIDEGIYGICDKCSKEIEEKRLDANPASITCVEHGGDIN